MSARTRDFDRRKFLAAAAATTMLPRIGFAQDVYPSRPIAIINPFPPGGATDVVTRPLAAAMEPIVKQAVVIETKPGAAGAVGAQVAASAKPDGYTILSHLPSLSGFAEVDKLFDRQPKFTNADFIPIARIIADPCVLIVNDKQNYASAKDFITDAKKRPNEILFSSSGLYGALHIPMELSPTPPISSCAIFRQPAADPPSPRSLATTCRLWRRRSRRALRK